MSGKGGGTKTEYITQTVEDEPWEPQQDHLKNVFAGAQALYDGEGPEYFPGSTIIDQSPQTDLALRLVEERALNGSPLVRSAQNTVQNITDGGHFGDSPVTDFWTNKLDYTNSALPALQNLVDGRTPNQAIGFLQSTADGDYLNSNPYLSETITNATRPIIDEWRNSIAPGIDSGFAKAGRLNSGAYAQARNTSEETLARSLAEAATSAGLSNYNQERQNQIAAQGTIGSLYNQDFANDLGSINALGAAHLANENVGLTAGKVLGTDHARDLELQLRGSQVAPQMADLDYNDAVRLSGVGDARENYAQSQLTDQINRFNFEQNKEYDKLGKYMSLVGGGYGSSGTETKPVFSNPTSNFLGSVASGAGIASTLGVNPLYGAIGGGLLGLF